MWNSRSQKLVGFAMTQMEMSCLLIDYQTLEEDHATKGTNHILQFLWCDMTLNFDIVVPYYTSNGPFESKFLMGVLLDTVKVFTSLLVCDGASQTCQL